MFFKCAHVPALIKHKGHFDQQRGLVMRRECVFPFCTIFFVKVIRAGAQRNGVALANVRERLVSRYGREAGLTLELSPGAGARAVVQLPLEPLPA